VVKFVVCKEMNKPTKWQSQIDISHREWCRENGYPTDWYRARHGRPKLNKQANKQEGKYEKEKYTSTI